MSILFAANRSPTGHALALAVHQNADGRWYWYDGDNREIALAPGEDLYATAEDAKIAAHKRWQCVGDQRKRRSRNPVRVGVSALLFASLALASPPALARPNASKAHAAKERAVLVCIDERTGPTGGLDLDDASRLCRTIARHEAKVAKLAKLAAQARDAGIARLAKRAEWECAEEVSIACEDTTERSEDHGECSDATLEAKHAFDVCRKGGRHYRLAKEVK